MANAIQDRYAQDADRQTRAQLGYAQLDEERRRREAENNFRQAQLAQQPAMQEQAANLEMNQWMAKQRFTAQDQQQLSQQENATSELQDKLDKGEISQGEFYKMLNQVAPRVNYLKFKEQHTRNQAMEMQKKALADEMNSRTQMRQAALKRSADGFEDNVRFDLDPAAHDMLAKEVDTLDPTLQHLNPGRREQKIREMGEARGLGKRWLQQPDGKWQPYDESKGGSKGKSEKTSAAAKPPTEAHLNSEAKAILERKGVSKDSENYGAELNAEVERQKAAAAAKFAETPEGKVAAHKEQAAQLVSEYPKFQNAIQASINLNDSEKMAGMMLTKKIQEMVQHFGPPEAMNPELQKVYTHLASNLKKVIDKSGYKPTE